MTNQTTHVSRRNFIRAGAGAIATFQILPSSIFAKGNSPNEKLNLACIGVGGKGRGNVGSCRSQNVYALCDVDKNNLNKMAKNHKSAKLYQDWRVMLEKEADTLDGIVVSTPDHNHAIIAMTAMKLGIHVYVEKPLSRTISEARLLADAARKYKICSQMGNQGHAREGARLTNEWIQSGALGEIKEIHCQTNRPIWPQDVLRPAAQPVPDHLNWDVWLGPAPEASYNSKIAPFKWRGYWDYGAGALGDMGAHIVDHPVWALNLGAPLSVIAEFSRKTKGSEKVTFPSASQVTYEFAARGDQPPVTLKWFDGKKGNKMPQPPMLEKNRKPNAVVYYGSKLTMMHGTHGGAPRIIPEAEMKTFKRPPKTMERSPGHFQEWFEAIKKKDPSLAKSNFDYSGPLTETLLIGCLAQRAGSDVKLTWDSKNMKTDNEQANQYVKEPYRNGWEL